MKFSKEERRKIYKEAYKIHLKDIEFSIKEDIGLNGMCMDLNEAVEDIYGVIVSIEDLYDSLPEFKKLKPENVGDYEYWWDGRDYEIRKQVYEEYLINI